jgi:hypothetical protein
MAHLWFQDEAGHWTALPLGGDEVSLGGFPPAPVAAGAPLATHTVLPVAGGDGPAWALLVAPGGEVRVNGLPPVAGLRVLHDRDEISAAAPGAVFFSTETRPVVAGFPGKDHTVFCGRCRLPVETGQPAVACPQCGLWYHQSADSGCWTYGPHCAYCTQETALEAGFHWVPEE